MPISKERLASIISGKAAALCDPAYDNTKSVQNAARGKINESMGGPSVSDYDADAERWDRMFSDSADEDYRPVSDIQYNDGAVENSMLPDAVKKSMMEHRIDVSSLGNTSVLDSMGIKGKPITAPMQRRQVVNEQRPSQPQPQYGGGIDYSIVKAIVSECLKEYFSNNVLNEGTLTQIHLKEGTIGLVDNSGNVYKAKLERVKKKGNQ